MKFEELLDNYFLNYNLNLNINGNEYYVNPKNLNSLNADSSFNSGYKIPINSVTMADALVSRLENGDIDFFPELALMFLKTYTKKLLNNSDASLSTQKMVTLFNKNQELVEIPYPIVLLIGGLYYFQENKSLLKDQTLKSNIFSRTDGNPVFKSKYTDLERGMGYVENYSTNELNFSAKIYFPSVRLLNRSLSHSSSETFGTTLKYKNFDGQEVEERLELSLKTIMPIIGYGIQNKFLNHYNKVLFGDNFNGTNDDRYNSTRTLGGGEADTNSFDYALPVNVIEGGYLGKIKPIKTYDSEVEFTAFYRNLYVGNINYDIDSLVNEFNEITKNINKTNEYSVKTSLIKSFLVFSKLKATFLSGNIDNYDSFLVIIRKLCEIKNIDIKYNTNLGNDSKLCDFYFMVSHMFFSSFYQIDSKNALNVFGLNFHPYDIMNRFDFGFNGSDKYRKTILNNKLYLLLNKNNANLDEQAISITNFLFYLWSIEKNNLIKGYSSVDSKAVFALYPSAGGFITPQQVFCPSYENHNLPYNNRNDDVLGVEDRTIELLGQNSFTGRDWVKFWVKVVEDNNETGYNIDNFYKSNSSYSPVKPRSFNTDTKKVFSEEINSISKDKNLNSPVIPKYIVSKTFDNKDFLNRYCFNNYAILKNTTRFLWFEHNNFGLDLKLDKVDDNNKSNFYFEYEDGFSSCFDNNNIKVDYLRNITNKLFDNKTSNNYKNSDYNSLYSFVRLVDSFNLEKLEEFKNLFVDFSTFTKNNLKYNNSFDLQSLMKASSVVGASDIFSDTSLFPSNLYKDQSNGFSLSGSEVWLMLIGNSMFNYEFVNKCGLSKFFNAALTSSQKKRCEDVVNQFCSHNITIANKSAIDSVSKLGDFDLSIHKFYSLPEILYSNTKDYEEFKSNLKGSLSDSQFNRYLARRILFADQYVPSYMEVLNEVEIDELNAIYLYDIFRWKKYNKENQIFFYRQLVKNFFGYLNLRFTKENYKQLIKLIRTLASKLAKKVDIIHLGLNPAQTDISYEEYIDIKNQNTEYVEYDFIGAINLFSGGLNEFFAEFNEKVFNSTVSGVNSYLNAINNLLNEIDTSSSSDGSFTKPIDLVNDFKKSTYYNIKSLYQKFSSNSNRRSVDEMAISKPEDLKSLNTSDLVNSSLFYNYRFSYDYCGEDEFESRNRNYDLYQIFQVVDRGNNDIGTKVLADLVYLYNNLHIDFAESDTEKNIDGFERFSNLTSGNFQKLFSGLAKESGFILQQIPNYLNLNSAISNLNNNDEDLYTLVDDLFGVHTNTSLVGTGLSLKDKDNYYFGGLSGLPGFIYQLGSVDSEVHSNTNKVNDNLNSFCLDIGESNGEIFVKDDNAPDDIKKSNITSFTVDFASQNQQIFKNIQLDTSEFYYTEEALKNWVSVVNNTQNNLKTANIFPIMEKRSYSCTVESMGNATIQPLTYFYLRNVPLFYGAYWITNVSHDISPNDMKTTFKGVRQPIVNKTNNRKQLLYLIREQVEEIRKESVEANTVSEVLLTNPETSGEIYQISDSDKPYGELMQITSDNVRYFRYDSMTVIGSFIYSVTKSNFLDASNIGMINVLYNQSKSYLGNNAPHSEIIKNFKNVVVGLMRERIELGDKRYGDSAVSLSKLLTETPGFSFNGELYNALSIITSSKAFNEKIKNLPQNTKLYNVRVDLNLNGDARFFMDSQINVKDVTAIPIKEANFYVEENDILLNKDYSFNLAGLGDNKLKSIFGIFDNDVRQINMPKSLAYERSTNTNTNTNSPNTPIMGQFSSIDSPIPNNSIGTVDLSTNVPNTYIKFLGATESGKVGFFSSKNDKVFGDVNMVTNLKYKYDLSNSQETQLDNEYVTPTLGDSERTRFINNLVKNAFDEYSKWNPVGKPRLTECESDAAPLLKKYFEVPKLSRYTCKTAWSGAFISYLIKSSLPNPDDFPYNIRHSKYITYVRDNNTSWTAYSVKDRVNGRVSLGDIICRYTYSKNVFIELENFPNNTEGHCDCVVEIDTEKGEYYTIGGNLSESSLKQRYSLIDNNFANSDDYSVILRYKPHAMTSLNPTTAGVNVNFTSFQKYPRLMGIVLAGESHTYNCHNWKNTSGNYNSYFDDLVIRKGNEPFPSLTKKLTEYTIREIRSFQKMNGNKLNAVGRYQIIASTFSDDLIQRSGVSEDDLFTPEIQDKLGMGLLRAPELDYISGKATDTKDNLEDAATSISKRWAAVGVPKEMDGHKRRVKKNESFFAGDGINKARVRTEDVQEALRYHRANP